MEKRYDLINKIFSENLQEIFLPFLRENHIHSFIDDYEQKKSEKYAIQPFYNRKNYDGKKNEELFIDFLEKEENILWWFKNGDYGRDSFAIEYTDKNDKLSLFYPDFLVKTKNERLGIFDTKGGQTAELSKEKAEALQKYIVE